ncbi:MAG TPA: substrate-binding domain-containing protein [Planctomycetota bacterium]|jgi:ribose transport system substrate-binding protein|nr:substrate-binding domain-containing protein [Planctomycetota bacterium]
MKPALLSTLGFLLPLALLPACGRSSKRKPVVAFSQCTTTEPWRVLFNRELKREAAKHADLFDLVVADADDRTDRQVEQVENFIRQKVDVLLVSPKESPGLTPVVERAIDAGIPVLVLDRNVATDRITAFIGGDNREIGRAAGKFAVERLGGPGKAKGNVVEIWGGMASTPAQERHLGFRDFVAKEPGIGVLLDNQDGDWKKEKGYAIMETALKAFPTIDLVYAHNDPMAYGAYLAAKDAGREKEIAFVGIDAIPEEGGVWVKKGWLTATFVYATPGAEAIRQAARILSGESVPRTTPLATRAVTRQTVDAFLAEAGVKSD